MRRLNLLGSLAAGLLLICGTVAPLFAAYTFTITVVDNGTMSELLTAGSFPDMPVIAATNVSNLVSGGYIGADGLDVRVLDGATEVPFMLADDKILFVDTITKGATKALTVTTGNTPLDSMPFIMGFGGFITIPDVPSLEPGGDDFNISFSGYVNYYHNGMLFSKGSDLTIEQTRGTPSGTSDITVTVRGASITLQVVNGVYEFNAYGAGATLHFDIYDDGGIYATDTDTMSVGSVPDNASDFIIGEDGGRTLPYFIGSCGMSFDGVRTDGFLFNANISTIFAGSTFHDEMNSNDGTITWGENPSSMTVTVSGIHSSSTPSFANDLALGGETPGILGGTDGLSNTSGTTTGSFLDPIISAFVNASGGSLTLDTVWWGIYLIVLLFSFGASYAAFQKLFVSSAAAVIVSIPFTIAWGVIPLIVLVLLVAFLIGTFLMEQRQTV